MNTDPKPSSYMSPRATSRMTGVSIKTLESMRSQRRGPPFYRVGRLIRYREDEVQAWMERQREACEAA